jgi:aerobic carbon-monoxide dehydrogenase medium subunit
MTLLPIYILFVVEVHRMKPPRFTYHDPRERSEVLALLDTYEDDAKLLAGGQSLLPLLNMRLAQPAHLIDINRVTDLSYIREQDDEIIIGALTRQRDIERSSLVRERCPLLVEAISFVGHAPIRSRGTIGGSLAHADPAAELPAVLMALSGFVHVESQHGMREIAAVDFFTGQLESALTSKELLTAVRFPVAPPRSGAVFLEISRRHGDYALVGVATQLAFDQQGVIIEPRVALMGVADTPVRAAASEALLLHARPDEELFKFAAEQAISDLDPPGDLHATTEYRRQVTITLVERALRTATERARKGAVA